MRKFPLIFILLLSALATPQEVFACSCIGFTDTEEQHTASYSNADLIIQGSAISVTEKSMSLVYNVSVEKVWKGQADAYIEIETANNSAACGIQLPPNESTIIFINTNDGTYHTGLCSGTTAVDIADLAIWLDNHDGTEPEAEPEVIAGPEHEEDPVEEENRVFDDVPPNHPNVKAITFVRNEGIVKGYEDGTFRPNQTINRAEFTKIIITANFTQEATDNCESQDLFSDVHQSDWYADYVCIGKNDNVIDGYDDGTFRPSNPVNFAEAAKIVINAFAIKTNPEDQQLSVWWKPYVFAMSRIGGLPPSFTDPNQLLTRGEMAEIIYRVMTGM